jgi:hypothetical protein
VSFLFEVSAAAYCDIQKEELVFLLVNT